MLYFSIGMFRLDTLRLLLAATALAVVSEHLWDPSE